MLIVTRRVGETVWVGDGVEIRVLDASPTRVRLGIVAPREMPIQRGEMKAAVEQNRAASRMEEQALTGVLRYIRSQGPSE